MRPDATARPRAASTAPLPVERFFQFSLLGLMASGYLAVAGSAYLDIPTLVLTGGGILLRALLVGGLVRVNLSERAATIAAVAYAGFFPIDYFLLSHDFLSSTVHLVFFLAVVKILTAKTNRDNLYIAVIAFLELLAAAILSIDFNFFLCLALFLLFAIAALTSGEIRRSMHKAPSTSRAGLKHFHSRLALLGLWIALGILTLTAGMFFLLPRTADAALSTLTAHHIRVPGYSEQVTLGEIGELKISTRPVMHIAIDGNQKMGSAKWRGDVLTDFDGRVWSRQAPDPGAGGMKAIGGYVSLGARPAHSEVTAWSLPIWNRGRCFLPGPRRLSTDCRTAPVWRRKPNAFACGRRRHRASGMKWPASSKSPRKPRRRSIPRRFSI